MAWKTPGIKKVAEQLGGQQVTSGRRVPRRVPGTKRTPEGPGERQGARRAQGDQNGVKLRVAKKAPFVCHLYFVCCSFYTNVFPTFNIMLELVPNQSSIVPNAHLSGADRRLTWLSCLV